MKALPSHPTKRLSASSWYGIGSSAGYGIVARPFSNYPAGRKARTTCATALSTTARWWPSGDGWLLVSLLGFVITSGSSSYRAGGQPISQPSPEATPRKAPYPMPFSGFGLTASGHQRDNYGLTGPDTRQICRVRVWRQSPPLRVLNQLAKKRGESPIVSRLSRFRFWVPCGRQSPPQRGVPNQFREVLRKLAHRSGSRRSEKRVGELISKKKSVGCRITASRFPAPSWDERCF